MPSSFASRRAIANASSLETWTHSTICGFPCAVLQMQIFGNESRARALNLVRAGLDRLAGERLRNDRRILRLNRDGLERRLLRLDDFHAAGDGAARADGRDQDVHLAVRVVPDFLRRGLLVDFRIGRIFKLLRNPGIRRFLRQLLRRGQSRPSCLRRRASERVSRRASPAACAVPATSSPAS